jgi:hypothetical protein
MTKSQVINFKLSGGNRLFFDQNKEYQMLIDSFGYVAFRDIESGNYLPCGFKEVQS